MKYNNTQETFIKDSNVEILIGSGAPQTTSGKKKTDYWSMIIIAIIMLALAAYGIMARLGIV